MIDYDTKNSSFLRLSRQLKRDIIQNYDFMLELNDEDLLDIDPYDPDLSDEMIDKIKEECTNNIYYFFREILRIDYDYSEDRPRTQLPDIRRFQLNKANCAQIYCVANNYDSWVTSPKSTGKTLSTLCIGIYLSLFYNEKSLLVGLPKSLKDTIDISCRQIILPKYLAKEYNLYYKEAILEDIDKYIMFDNIHFIDSEFIPYIDIIYSEIKRINKDNTRLMFESLYSNDAKENGAINILNKAAVWNSNMYDNLEYIPRGRIINIKYGYQDLDLSKNYFKDYTEILQNNKEAIRLQLLLIR